MESDTKRLRTSLTSPRVMFAVPRRAARGVESSAPRLLWASDGRSAIGVAGSCRHLQWLISLSSPRGSAGQLGESGALWVRNAEIEPGAEGSCQGPSREPFAN